MSVGQPVPLKKRSRDSNMPVALSTCVFGTQPLPTEIAGVAFVSDKARNAIDAVGVWPLSQMIAPRSTLARIFVGAIREPAPALRTRVNIEILR